MGRNMRQEWFNGHMPSFAQVWDVIPLESSTLYSEAERRALETALPEPQRAVFRLVSPDGEGGFPGEVTTDVVMGVVAGEGKEAVGAVVIIYRAALSKGGIETPINLTQ
jgi:aldose 1-epimerase